MEKDHFNPRINYLIIENPKKTSPLELRELIFDGPSKSIVLEKGSHRVKIPSETLQTMISFKEGVIKAKHMTQLFNAFQDATKITLIPEE